MLACPFLAAKGAVFVTMPQFWFNAVEVEDGVIVGVEVFGKVPVGVGVIVMVGVDVIVGVGVPEGGEYQTSFIFTEELIAPPITHT